MNCYHFSPEPQNWQEALASDEADEWISAGLTEINGLHEAKTWILVPREQAAGKKIFRARTVFKRKMLPPTPQHPNGSVDKYKVRITIAAFKHMLIDGVDYRDKYASTPRWQSIRIMLAMAAHFDLEIELNDIVAFFLQARRGD